MHRDRPIDIDDDWLPADYSHIVRDQALEHSVADHDAQNVAQGAPGQKDSLNKHSASPPRVGSGCVFMRYDGTKDPRTLVGVVVQTHTTLDTNVKVCATTLESMLIARPDTFTIMPKFQVQTLKFERVTADVFDREWCLYQKEDSPVMDQILHLSKLQGWSRAASDTHGSEPEKEPRAEDRLIPRPRGRAPRHKTWDSNTGSWVPLKHVSHRLEERASVVATPLRISPFGTPTSIAFSPTFTRCTQRIFLRSVFRVEAARRFNVCWN